MGITESVLREKDQFPMQKRTKSIVVLMIQEMRPKQWTKNLLVFAALIFSIQTLTINMLLKSILGFIIFCVVSGCIYILNDYVDREVDRNHPRKKNRPIASGMLSPNIALILGGAMLILSLLISYVLNPLYLMVLIFYFTLNVLYSFYLKHVVIIDVMIIAAGFVLRAIAGGLVISVPITPWFLICTMLLSLFLALSKRRHEVLLLRGNKGVHRKVLEFYSAELLDQLNGIVTTATIISYSLFTFTSGHSIYLMWTIPLVIYGIFRYLYLIHIEDKGGSPEQVLIEDKPILVTTMLFAISVIIILAFF